MNTPETPLRLFRSAVSGHCHRVELFLSLLGLPVELIDVDLRARAHKQPEFLAKNRFGQVPVLEDAGVTLADSNAILVYLAERYDTAREYWPSSAERRAGVQRWLSVAAGQLAAGPAAARAVRVFGAPLDYGVAHKEAHDLFALLESELEGRAFLVGVGPTLADLALYAYTAHAPEGDVSLDGYPAIREWLGRIEALPRFVAMKPVEARA